MAFITGASGLVGSFVVREFLRRGQPVRALRRPGSDMRLLADVAAHVEWVEADLFDLTRLAKAIRPGEVVVHAAALVSFAPARKAEMFKANVEGTANLVNICLERNIKKFVLVSSVAALGRSRNQKLLDETAKWEPSELNTAYAQTKHLAELELWRAHAEGLPALAVNPSVVLGPGDWHRSSTRLFRYAHSEHFFYPPGQVNYVDVRDVAEAVFLLAGSELNGEKFILNAGTVSYRELLIQAARRFGKRGPRWPVRPWMAALGWRLEWLRSRLGAGGEPLLTRETARMAQTHYAYRNDKIRRETGFEFRKLADTLDWACARLQADSVP